jgi:hypothetical protein
MADKLSCLRCQGDMEAGFISHPTTGQQVWFEGEVPTTLRGSFMTGRNRFVVVSHRYPNCGYLESYARSTPAPQ